MSRDENPQRENVMNSLDQLDFTRMFRFDRVDTAVGAMRKVDPAKWATLPPKMANPAR